MDHAQGTASPQATRSERTMTTGQVAKLFHVDPRTVRTWDAILSGALSRTLGGHRRYRESAVLAAKAALAPGAVT